MPQPHHVPVAEPNVSSAAGGVEGHDVSSMGGSVGTIAGSMNDPSQCIESTSSTKKFSKAKPQQYDIEFPLRRPPVRKVIDLSYCRWYRVAISV